MPDLKTTQDDKKPDDSSDSSVPESQVNLSNVPPVSSSVKPPQDQMQGEQAGSSLSGGPAGGQQKPVGAPGVPQQAPAGDVTGASQGATSDQGSQADDLSGQSGPQDISTVEPAKESKVAAGSQQDKPADTAQQGTPSTTPQSDISNMAKPVSPPAEAPGTDANLMQKKEDQKPDEVSTGGSVPSDAGVETPSVPSAQPGVSQASTGGEGEEEKKVSDVPPVSQPVTPPTGSVPSPVPSPTTGASSQASPTGTVGSGASTGPKDPELVKMHEPVIVMPDRLEMGQIVTVKVKVGMIGHVMEDTHYIQSIELFTNDNSVGKVDLNPKENSVAEADFQVPLSAGMQLKAVINCNMHGKWESSMSV